MNLPRAQRPPPDEEIKTPLYGIQEFLTSFSDLLNSLFDAIESRTARLVISHESRVAIILAIVLALGSGFKDSFQLVLTGVPAAIGAVLLLFFAALDILMRTRGPWNLRAQHRISEIAAAINGGRYPPEHSALYLREIDFDSDAISNFVGSFARLPPIVQAYFVRFQALSAGQLLELAAQPLSRRVVQTLVTRYPHAFPVTVVEKWLKQFNRNDQLVNDLITQQLGDPSDEQLLVKCLTNPVLARILANLEYSKNPSVIAKVLQKNRKTVAGLVIIPFWCWSIVWIGQHPELFMNPSISNNSASAALLGSVVILLSLVSGATMFWYCWVAGLGYGFARLGLVLEHRAKKRLEFTHMSRPSGQN